MFGKYSVIIDELIHFAIAGTITTITTLLGDLLPIQALLLFLSASILIDLDHLLNPLIAKILNITCNIIPSRKNNGYTIKILHGIDIALLLGLVLYFISHNLSFSIGLSLGLITHEVYDFLVYPFTWKELFLITRAMCKFKPGERKRCKNLIFKT